MNRSDIQIPEWLRKFAVGVNTLTFNGVTYPYLIIDKKLEPKLPGFVSFSGGLLFVSEEVPVGFREFFLLHEILEFQEPTERKGRCLKVLQQELVFVPAEIKKSYIAYRREFFSRLVSYYADGDKRGTPEFRDEIAGSLKYLQGL